MKKQIRAIVTYDVEYDNESDLPEIEKAICNGTPDRCWCTRYAFDITDTKILLGERSDEKTITRL